MLYRIDIYYCIKCLNYIHVSDTTNNGILLGPQKALQNLNLHFYHQSYQLSKQGFEIIAKLPCKRWRKSDVDTNKIQRKSLYIHEQVFFIMQYNKTVEFKLRQVDRIAIALIHK